MSHALIALEAARVHEETTARFEAGEEKSNPYDPKGWPHYRAYESTWRDLEHARDCDPEACCAKHAKHRAKRYSMWKDTTWCALCPENKPSEDRS